MKPTDDAIHKALANYGVTVYRDGSYVVASCLDNVYRRNDPDWLCDFPLSTLLCIAIENDNVKPKKEKCR